MKNQIFKKAISVVLILVLIMSPVPVSSFTAFAKDSHGPFIQVIEEPDASATVISTPSDLVAINNDLYGSYVLANDIDMSNYGSWTPIGKLTASPFKGKLDGQGHSITGLKIDVSIDSASLNNPAHGVGLFGICDGAVIKNIALKNVDISITNTSGYEYTNVKIKGRNIFAGAVAGYMYNESVVYNSFATGSIFATASGEAEGASAGGLIGYANSVIVSYSYSKCEITSKSQNQMYSAPSNAGGIIGLSEGAGYIDRCYNTGAVESISADFGDSVAGGLIGKNTSTGFSISDSFNEGAVTASAGNLFSDSAYAGGIAGYFSGVINNTYNAGAVNSYGTSVVSQDKAYAAGICGSAQNNASINCSAIVVPSVSAQGSSKTVARIANGGDKSNNISTSSYASGSDLDATYYLSESVLKTSDPYVEDLSWDFADVWEMTDNKDYPQLQQVLDSNTKYINNYIQEHLAFINGDVYADVLNNKRWASIYWSEEYCGSNNGWYTGFDAFGDFATLHWGELFKEENLFPLILADYINNQGIAEKITELTRLSLPLNLDKKYSKGKTFIKKYWDGDQFGNLSDEDLFYLFHYDEKSSDEWVNSNFPEGLEYIVYDTRHEGEWFTDVLGVADDAITSISEAKDKINNVIDFINGCMEVSASIETFLSTSDEFKEILQTMYENIDTSFTNELSHLFGYDLKEQSIIKLRAALSSYVNFISSSKEGMRVELWARFALEANAKKIMEDIKNSVISKTVEWFTSVISSTALNILKALGWVADAIAKLIDFLTNEKDLRQYRALLQANRIFENVMYKAIGDIQSRFVSDPTFENAKLFDAAFKFFKETEIYSMDVLVKYLDTFQASYWTTINNMSCSTKASEIEEVLINKRTLYNTLCHGTHYSLGGKIITIACPTDISLLDENNTEVVSIVSDLVTCNDENIDVFVTHGVKYILVPVDHEYTLSITATGNGKMEYSVAEYNDQMINVQTAIYTDIPLTEGTSFEGCICGDLNASENAYNLYSNDQVIEPTFVANESNLIIPPSTLDFSQRKAKILKGNTYQIMYDISPDNSSVNALLWTSSDGTVATVSENGLVTALNPGTVTISGFTFVGGISDSVEISVLDPNELSIMTAELPNGFVGLSYDPIQLLATEDEVSWEVTEGSLPVGLTLSPEGVISGAPLEEGTFSFVVKAEDSTDNSTYEEMTIEIDGIASAPVFITESLPHATVNTHYSASIEVEATPNASFSIVEGELPSGVSIDKNGVVSGTTLNAGVYYFTVKAHNGVLPDAFADYTLVVDNRALDSGTTGDLSWTIYDSGELTIAGNGAPASYDSKQAPWYQYVDDITSVTFDGSITKISSYMFEDCANLQILTIPNSVTTIEENALNGCVGLTELTIPFVGSSRTAKNTYDAVFGHIFGRVANSANGIVQYYEEADGSLSGYKYAVPSSLKKVTVTDATQLAFGAFNNCADIEEIVLNDGIISIAGYAFNGDSSIRSLVIPDSVEVIEEFALDGCASLESLTIPFVGESRNVTNDYTAVLGFIFGRTNDGGTKQYFEFADGSLYSYKYNIPTTLKSVTITDDPSIALAAFSNCTFLQKIILEEPTIELEDFVIYGIESLERLEIQNRYCSIIDNYNTFSISGIVYGYSDSTAESFASSKNIAFVPLDETNPHTGDEGEITGITISENEVTIGAFESEQLTAEIIYTGTMPDYDISWSSSDNSIVVVDQTGKITGKNTGTATITAEVGGFTATCAVTVIDDGLSGSCGDSATWSIDDNMVLTITGTGSVTSSPWRKDITGVIIDKEITTINSGLFSDCEELTSFEVDEENENYCSIDGVLFNKDITKLISYPIGLILDSYNMPDTVVDIAPEAFALTCNIKEIVLSRKLKNLNSICLSRLVNTERFEIPEDAEKLCTVDGVLYTKNMQELVNYPAGKIASQFIIPEQTTILDICSFNNVKIDVLIIHENVSKFNFGIGSFMYGSFSNSRINDMVVLGNTTMPSRADGDALQQTTIYYYSTNSKAQSFANNYSMQSVLLDEPHEHKYYIKLQQEKTDTTDGIIVKSSYCGEVISTEVDHHYSEMIPAKDAKCLEAGNKAYYQCSVCEEYFNENKELADFETDILVPALDHDYVSVITVPTCTEGGYTTYTCSRCGDTYTGNETDAITHDWGEWFVTTEPSCTEAGEETRTCQRVGCDAEETRPVDALTHNYASVVTSPTCTEGGFTTYTCSRCGDTYTDDETSALTHDWGEWTVTTEPSCTETGEETRSCQREGCDAEETRPVNAINHNWSDWADNGENHIRHCLRDNCTETETAGHSWNEGVVTKEASCAEEGEMTYTCTLCEGTKTESIGKLRHVSGTPVKENEVAPTCTSEGSYDSVVYCVNCPEELNRETITVKKLDHTPAAAVIENEVPATCTKKGSYDSVVYCKNCPAEISRTKVTTNKLPHTPATLPGTPATCVNDGLTDGQICASCGNMITAQHTIPATGKHVDNNGDGKCDTCGTAVETPSNPNTCKWCGKEHGSGFIDKLIAFFHRIFAAIFGAKY